MLNSVLFASVYEGSGQFMVIAVVALVVLKVLISLYTSFSCRLRAWSALLLDTATARAVNI